MVESVVSVAILALVIAGSYMLMVRTSTVLRVARNHYVALNLCKSRVERARNFAYEDLSLLVETNLVVNDDGTSLSSGAFRRTTSVNPNYRSGLTLLTVRTEIRNIKTQTFKGEDESVAALFTDYLQR